MSSQNYTISQDSINASGMDDGRSAGYQLKDTVGEAATGQSDSPWYRLEAGYRNTDYDSAVLQFRVGTANPTTKIAYTTLRSGGATSSVVVSSAAGYNIDDYIVAVENEGASAMLTIGKVMAINGNDLQVDLWTGDQGSMSASPAGGNDFVYKLSSNALDLGLLDFISIKTGVSFVDVTTNSQTGYTVSIASDQNLQYVPDNGLKPVGDGAVTAGQGEYGVESVGPYAQGAGDWSIATTTKPFALYTSSWAERHRTGAIYKASANMSTPAGSYRQTVTYYATANF